MTEIESMPFEEAYSRLSETTQKLEAGNLSLDESLALFEEGITLSRLCERLLTQAELRVSQIVTTAMEEDEEDEEADAPLSDTSNIPTKGFIDPMLLEGDSQPASSRKKSGRIGPAQPSFSFDE